MGEIRYFKVRLDDVVEKLKEYFSSRREVSVAILFGSILRRDVVRDIDIAVYGSSRDLDTILRIGWELEDLLKMPVDVVPLEELSPRFRMAVLTRGLPITIKSSADYTELIKITVAELEDIEIIERYSVGRCSKR